MNTFHTRKTIRMSRDVYRQRNVFFITITTSERHPWFSSHPVFAAAATRILCDIATERETTLFAWCIMPDHLHILLQDKDIVEFVRVFKGRLTPEARKLEPETTLWQRSFHDHGLRREEALVDVASYIWMNPVRAGIADCASSHPWSGSLVWPDWKEKIGRHYSGK